MRVTTQTSSQDPAGWLRGRLAGLRRIAIVPALNEETSIAGVVDEIRAADPEFEVIVVDDGSHDRTAEGCLCGRRARRQPSVQPWHRRRGPDGVCSTTNQEFPGRLQVDGDAQHDPTEIPKLLAPIIEDRADLVVGSRFLGDGDYRPPVSRLLGIRLLARIVSMIVRQRVTDTTSGFRAANRRAIDLFAADYPHDYPEVEATVLVVRHRLRMVEVPVHMRLRTTGSSSITFRSSAYYMYKVLLALFIGLFRRFPTPLEEK